MPIGLSITKPAVIATTANASDVNTPISEIEQLLEDIVNGVQKQEVTRFISVATPANPASTEFKLYVKSGTSVLHLLDSAGNEWAFSTVDPAICAGRLTLSSGVAVTTSDVTAATTLYFTPYKGNKIALFNGTVWSIFSFSEVSLSLAGLAANTPYDIWAYSSGSAVVLEALAWTNDTTRATALVLQDGVYVKTGATTRRYLGTIRITATIGQCEDSVLNRLVYNHYNHAARKLAVIEAANSWTYATATYRSFNNSVANRVSFVRGVNEEPVNLRFMAAVNAPAGINGAIGIGLDSTTVNNADPRGFVQNAITTVQAEYLDSPAVGYHFLQLLEISSGATTTFYGDNGVAYIQSGAVGTVMA